MLLILLLCSCVPQLLVSTVVAIYLCTELIWLTALLFRLSTSVPALKMIHTLIFTQVFAKFSVSISSLMISLTAGVGEGCGLKFVALSSTR